MASWRVQSFSKLVLTKELSYTVSSKLCIPFQDDRQRQAKTVSKGVNTGFGGSADTRTKGVDELQATLIRELHSGILSNPTRQTQSTSDALPCEDADSNTCMPEAWARASILVRINSLASGHSGVRSVLINNMVELLKQDIVPRIPLRGSISASGDLMPLSYIGGALEGKRGITVWAGSRPNRRIVTADVALAESSLHPIKLGPKEGLAIINGTAVSTGVAALAIHDANSLAALSQLLTAMSVEALRGTDESFDPFFGAVRPHPGQIEAARNIRSFLAESKLVQRNDGSEAGTLRQDRYSIRTAPQWLGPILEDLRLASQQVTIECNSVTDNPLIDLNLDNTENARILHGGNFQAKAITSAMEKTRSAAQTIGQMLFAQCTEIINPRLNYGLPPSLVVDEPSQSFLLKPVDIMIAALQSELGFLANPAGTHVQSAEMGNQALNSLGLMSARYTHTALDVLSQLASAHLFTLCQALDLRAMHFKFLEAVEMTIRTHTSEILADVLDEGNALSNGTSKAPISPLEKLHTILFQAFTTHLSQTTTLDSAQRFPTIFQSLQPTILSLASPSSSQTVPAIRKWTQQCSTSALAIFLETRDSYHASPDASPILGLGARRMYDFVRKELRVPFLRTGMLKAGGNYDARCDSDGGNLTTGGLITRIYQSIRSGALYGPVMECLAEVDLSSQKA